MSRKISDLVPLDLKTEYKAVPGYIGKLEKTTVLATHKGEIVCKDIPWEWLQYIKDAVNDYADKDRKEERIHSDLICKVRIPGVATPKLEGKSIARDKDGNYIMSASKEYSRRIRQVTNQKQKILYGLPKLPITGKLHIKCIIYMNNKQLKPCMPELVTATLDLLKRLGVIRSVNIDTVARTDGSAVQYVLGEPYTLVEIRRLKAGYEEN